MKSPIFAVCEKWDSFSFPASNSYRLLIQSKHHEQERRLWSLVFKIARDCCKKIPFSLLTNDRGVQICTLDEILMKHSCLSCAKSEIRSLFQRQIHNSLFVQYKQTSWTYRRGGSEVLSSRSHEAAARRYSWPSLDWRLCGVQIIVCCPFDEIFLLKHSSLLCELQACRINSLIKSLSEFCLSDKYVTSSLLSFYRSLA
jgi:hypothetical protein